MGLLLMNYTSILSGKEGGGIGQKKSWVNGMKKIL